MGVIETNQWYANLLGWTPADFGCPAIDASLVAAIQKTQTRLEIGVDGKCGPMTYGAVLGDRQKQLLAGLPSSTDPLADAGQIALCEAKQTWLLDVVDLPTSGTRAYAKSQQLIDQMIRSDAGLDWSWEQPYNRNFEWCGAFASYAWRAAGLALLPWRHYFFSSTLRLDRWGRYQPFDEKTPNPRPAAGVSPRKMKELDESSGPLDAHFDDGDPPRAGDILLVGGVNTAYGKHVTVVESYNTITGMFTTIEGNATGAGPAGGTRHGVIRGQRPVGLPRGASPTTYHARRLIRPALSDLRQP